jgi:hypothetical protein
VQRILCCLFCAFLGAPCLLPAQIPGNGADSPFFFTTVEPLGPVDGAGGGTGGGQVVPAGYGERYLTRLSFGGSVSTIGTGGELATNLPYHLDARVFGNFTDFDWKLTRSGFYVVVNIGMANTGALVDFYPWKALRISPGVLFYNTNRIRGDVRAENGATFTINNVNYASLDSNPVHGIGRLQLGGTGFMATTGWGHYVARNEKHWSYPVEVGAAFIDTPVATFNLYGDVCNAQGHDCMPAASFPGFESNLAAQLASWNRTVSPFHVYPLVQAGVAYTFRYRR